MKCVHYSKRMLRKQDCIMFRGRIAWQEFLENNFADFSDVMQVKKYQDFVELLVAFQRSNISYCIELLTENMIVPVIFLNQILNSVAKLSSAYLSSWSLNLTSCHLKFTNGINMGYF